MSLNVKCRNCGKIHYETNDEDGWLQVDSGSIPNPRVKKYYPDKATTSAMLRLKEPYKSWGWNDLSIDPGVIGDALECPECGAPLPDSSWKVLTVSQKQPPRQPQPYRQKKVADNAR